MSLSILKYAFSSWRDARPGSRTPLWARWDDPAAALGVSEAGIHRMHKTWIRAAPANDPDLVFPPRAPDGIENAVRLTHNSNESSRGSDAGGHWLIQPLPSSARHIASRGHPPIKVHTGTVIAFSVSMASCVSGSMGVLLVLLDGCPACPASCLSCSCLSCSTIRPRAALPETKATVFIVRTHA